MAPTMLAWLASPTAWCVGGLLLFAALSRWRILQTRHGLMLLLTGLFASLALMASQAEVLEALLLPTRLVVLLFLCINLLAFWSVLHERLGSDVGEDESYLGAGPLPSSSELWVATVGGLGVLAAACCWGVPPTTAEVPAFFHGGLQLRGILVPWVADFLLPGLLLATLLALPWLHQPAGEDPPLPRNAGLIFFGLAWLLFILLPMATAAFQSLPGQPAAGSPLAPPERTLAQFFWYHAVEMEMPSQWVLREAPGMALLFLYFTLLPAALPRWRASRGLCRRCHKALGAQRYAVLLALLLIFSLVPLKMMSLWWFGIGEWIAIPELPFHF